MENIPESKWIGDGKIIWLDDPLKYSYLRESIGWFTTKNRKPFISKKIGKLIGYVVFGKNNRFSHLGYPPSYPRMYWWLKLQDRDLDPTGPYYKREGRFPSEAVNPKSIVNKGGEQCRQSSQ